MRGWYWGVAELRSSSATCNCRSRFLWLAVIKIISSRALRLVSSVGCSLSKPSIPLLLCSLASS
uniref:Uncharacterized protein n=1 Tax=Physcomitrium patens TaxID=3218 RepID=A0A2K1IW76_PHYPA|nr:hypothetical protein PHYPA_025475 [Physcomitrium patens]